MSGSRFSSEEWHRIFNQLVRAYPATFGKWGEEEIAESEATYYLYLQDIDLPLLRAAAARHISSNDWMPKISELRNMAYDTIKKQAGIPSAEAAWAEVIDLIQRVGPVMSADRLPQFSHEFVKQAVGRFGGWNLLCESTNQVADRAHFFRFYEEIAGAHKEKAVSAIPRHISRRLAGSGGLKQIGGAIDELPEVRR